MTEQQDDYHSNHGKMSSPLCTNSGTRMYPESTMLITEMEATGVQQLLKQEKMRVGYSFNTSPLSSRSVVKSNAPPTGSDKM